MGWFVLSSSYFINFDEMILYCTLIITYKGWDGGRLIYSISSQIKISEG